jgi:two-component system cell cycle sensor histidine kinase/response regulator CckA
MRSAADMETLERYRYIVENASDLIITVDLDDRITSANAAAERMLGYPPAELVGLPLESIVADPWRARLRNATAAKLERGRTTVYDLELLAADGSAVPVEVSSWLVVEDGEPVAMQAICRDMSESVAAEEALRERDGLLQQAFEETVLAMLVTRPDGRIRRVNQAFCDLLGYTADELRALDVVRLTHPDDRDDTMASLVALHDGTVTRYRREKRYLRKDGEVVRVQIGVTPVRDSAGAVVSFVAQVVDVTAQRDAEDAVRESEMLFRAAFDDAATGMLMVSAEGRIMRANAALAALLDYAPEELGGMDVVELSHPADRRVSFDSRERMRRGELRRAVLEKRYLRRDGVGVWVQIAASPVHDSAGALMCFLVQIVDLTARRESEERFRRLFESSPQGMAVVDEDGRLIQANAALGEILGYSTDELTGLAFTAFTHPGDRAADVELYRELMAGKRSHYELEKRYIRKDGGLVWGHLTAFALPERAGGPRLAIGVLSDVTERRMLEDQLRQSQRMEAIGQLAGGVAHDFNNLLTTVTSYCDLAADALPPDGDLVVRSSVEGIRAAAERGSDVTQQLLAFSRRQVLELTPIDLNAALVDQVRFLDRLLGEDIEVRLALARDLATVKMDAGQLTQLVINLAVNARDAMPEGGILTIETQSVELDRAPTTTGLVSGRYVLLAVSDTGCGMDDDTVRRIFEPFFTTKDPGKGTGLGLATVLGIVEQSGGRVSVYSEPGHGTTFKVYMPSNGSTPAVSAAPTAPAQRARPRGTGRILLVEDNDDVRGPLTRLLAELGYEVIPADGPDAALQLADGHPVDLLVTDVIMPAMNGRQLAEKLLVAQPDLRVLYMSGYTDDAVIARGVIEAGTAFLQKPFGADRLAQKVRELLDA